jgi:hypothetical protein
MSKKKKHPNSYEKLQRAWQARHDELVQNLWANHGDVLEPLQQAPTHVLATAFATLLLATNTLAHTVITQAAENNAPPQIIHSKETLVSTLSSMLPPDVTPLDPVVETEVGRVLGEYFHLAVTPELGGKRLNRSYGLIGAEQHLMRYPGDTMDTHFSSGEEAQLYTASGMAPGRGAWGYFAPSARSMTPEDVAREKYYIAVQTFLAPGWGEHTSEMYAFFKYRRMLVVNPENGKAVVAVIGDAGPAPSTGKHLGGSPEVMKYLERVDGAQKGPVLYYFLDDESSQIPLGPVTIQ